MQGRVHLSSLCVWGNSISITICSRHLLLLTSICLYSKKDGNIGMGDVRDQIKTKTQEQIKLIGLCLSWFFQGSPGQPGLPGKDGMKGGKVRKNALHVSNVMFSLFLHVQYDLFTLDFTELFCLYISMVCTSSKQIKRCMLK